MPTLKQITCSIQLGSANIPVPEHGIRYSDGKVETFIVVPEVDVPFTIHLKTQGYIGPGIAAFAFIDGEYHCNRNRTGLAFPSGPEVQPEDYETEIRLRQKEEKTADGSFVTRDWTFAKLNRLAADKAPDVNTSFLANVGTIEIVVLRCTTDAGDDTVPRRTIQDADKRVEKRKKGTTSRHAAKNEGQSTAYPPKEQASVAAPPSEAIQSNGPFGGLFGLLDGAQDCLSGSESVYDYGDGGESVGGLQGYQMDGATDASNDIELMRDVIRELQLLSVPKPEMERLWEGFANEEAGMRLDPGPQYNFPASDLRALQQQFNAVQRDKVRLEDLLATATSVVNNYRSYAMELRIADLTKKEGELMAAIARATPSDRYPPTARSGYGQDGAHWDKSAGPGWEQVGYGATNDTGAWQHTPAHQAGHVRFPSSNKGSGADWLDKRTRHSSVRSSNKSSQHGSRQKSEGSRAGGWHNSTGEHKPNQTNTWRGHQAQGDNDWDKKSTNEKRDDDAWAQKSAKDDWKASSHSKQATDDWNASAPGSSKSHTNSWGRDSGGAESTFNRAASHHREPTIKPYWTNWNKPAETKDQLGRDAEKDKPVPRQVYNYPASHLPLIPEDKVSGRDYGVQVSRGAQYTHFCRRPVYIDTMEAPYAIFSFKYRSRRALEKILKMEIHDSELRKVEQEAEKEKWSSMPKEQLVEELMNAQRRRGQGGGDRNSDRESHHWGEGGRSEKAQSSHGGNTPWHAGHHTQDKGWNTWASEKGRSKANSAASKATQEHFGPQELETKDANGSGVQW